MNLKDIIEIVKGKQVRTWSLDNLYTDLTGDYGYISCEDDCCRLTEAYYQKWLCTDSWVGGKVYFLDEEPVAISWQPARKSDEKIYWLSRELALKTKDYLISLMEKEDDSFVLIKPEQLEMEFDPKGYSVEYSISLLTNTIFRRSDDERCTISNKERSNFYKLPIEEWNMANVTFEDGRVERINLKDFYIPWGE